MGGKMRRTMRLKKTKMCGSTHRWASFDEPPCGWKKKESARQQLELHVLSNTFFRTRSFEHVLSNTFLLV